MAPNPVAIEITSLSRRNWDRRQADRRTRRHGRGNLRGIVGWIESVVAAVEPRGSIPNREMEQRPESLG